jgi:hypothetical protein
MSTVETTEEEEVTGKETVKNDSAKKPRRRNSGAVKKSENRETQPDDRDDILDGADSDDETIALLDPDAVEEKSPEETKTDLEKAEADLAVFESLSEPHKWVIGKPKDLGGEEDEYEIYMQRALSHVQRSKFIGLVMRTIARAIKEGGGVELPFGDALDPEAGSLQQRARMVMQQDITDVTSFVTVMFTLASYAEDFITDCYIIILQIPVEDRKWFRKVIDQRWDPDNEEWGITEKDTVNLLSRFFDQNYEEMRDFFVDGLGSMFRKMAAKEKAIRAKKAHSEALASSKRSKN